MNFLLGNERIKQISKIELGDHLDSLHSHLYLFIYLSVHSSFKRKITCRVCVCVCVCAQLLIPIQLFTTSWTVTHQAPLSMELSRQEYWSGLTFPPPGDLPDPGSNLHLLHVLPMLASRLFTTAPRGQSLSAIVHL